MSASDTYSPPKDPLQGKVIAGKYILHNKLGEGAMGSVYLAEHIGFHETRAIKIIQQHLADNPQVRQRFLDEVQITRKASLKTDHIVSIYDDFGFEDGVGYYVMEHLEGKILSEYIKESDELLPAWIVRVSTEICEAMEAAHNMGIIFRDLKPDNIFLVKHRFQDEFVKVIDFGIAKSNEFQTKNTQSGHISGTPLYMSPEQIRGPSKEQQKTGEALLDERTDIYSLGCVIYEMLTGKPPFYIDGWNSAMDMLVIFQHHLSTSPTPPRETRPDIPKALEQCVLKALEKDRDNRFRTMAEFSEELLLSIAELSDEHLDISEHEATILQSFPQKSQDSVDALVPDQVILSDQSSNDYPLELDDKASLDEALFGISNDECTLMNNSFASQQSDDAIVEEITQDNLPEAHALSDAIMKELGELASIELPEPLNNVSITQSPSMIPLGAKPLAKTELKKTSSLQVGLLNKKNELSKELPVKLTNIPSDADSVSLPILAISSELITPPPIIHKKPTQTTKTVRKKNKKQMILWWSILSVGLFLALGSVWFFISRQSHLNNTKIIIHSTNQPQNSLITVRKLSRPIVTIKPMKRIVKRRNPLIKHHPVITFRHKKKYRRCPRKSRRYRWIFVRFRKITPRAFRFEVRNRQLRVKYKGRRYACLRLPKRAKMLLIRSRKDPYENYSCKIKINSSIKTLRLKKLVSKNEPFPDIPDYCKL